jgi:uncharacterized protein
MTNSEQRLVIDANVFVSAVLSAQGKSRQAFDLAVATGVILMSDEVFAEVSEVLLRPKFDRYSNRTKREAFLDELLGIVEFVDIIEKINECRDAKDDKYLELACSGNADLILTGDDDLLVLHPFRQIPIVKVQTFLAPEAAEL